MRKGREEAEKGDVVNEKRKKSVHFKSDFTCLMRIKITNHVKTARKKGRRIKVCIIIISNVRARCQRK